MAPIREGLRKRQPLKTDESKITEPKVKKKPMSSAERSRLYRERLKGRENYENIQKMHCKRNKELRDKKIQNMTDQEKLDHRAAVRERVRKHREMKKLQNLGDETVVLRPTKILTRNQKEVIRKADCERKRKERTTWTPQKWRRHREQCRERYRQKMMKKAPIEATEEPAEKSTKSKRTEQRAFKQVSSKIPKDPELRKKVISKLLQQFACSEENNKKENPVALDCGNDRLLKKKVAMKLLDRARSVTAKPAAQYGMTRSFLYRMRKQLGKPLCLRQKSKRSLKRHHEAQEFYTCPQHAHQLSEKKKVKNGKPRYVLTKTLDEIYQEYRTEVTDPLSSSMFKKLRPKFVHLLSKEKLNQCLCDVCENIQLMIATINTNLPVEKRLKSKFHVCEVKLCAKENGFHPLRCIDGLCGSCGNEKLLDNFKDIALGVQVQWKIWGSDSATKRKVLLPKNGTLQDLVNQLKQAMSTFPKHLFNAEWQLKEFSSIRNHPPTDACIVVMDFAENYRCLLQDEAQSAHWGYSQVTIHPLVHYYTCRDCNKLTTDVIVAISDDMKHDTHSVQAFTKEALEVLMAKGSVFSRLIQWSDGCAAQYKCKTAFHDVINLGVHYNLKVERNFFGSRHGKNACDGESAVVKSFVTRAVKSRRVVIQSARDFFAYCKTHLRKADYIDNQCNHYRRDFVFVTGINREGPISDLHAVKGTRLLHSLKAKGYGKGEVLTRTLSCFCHGCESDGHCFNTSYVQPWKEVQLKGKNEAYTANRADNEQMLLDLEASIAALHQDNGQPADTWFRPNVFDLLM